MLTKLHAYLGLTLLLPLFIWAITGTVFLIKPGYEKAYAQLEVKTLPLTKSFAVPANGNWHEALYLHTVLGWHLLVKDEDGEVQHLNPQTLEEWPLPITEMVRVLLNDSIAVDVPRYGTVETIELKDGVYEAQTTTQVNLSFNWKTFELRQQGGDTRFINRLYRLHYLQWTPNPMLNQVFVIGALISLLVMCGISLRMLVTIHKWE